MDNYPTITAYFLRSIYILGTLFGLFACDSWQSEKVTPLKSSKDFWIDRCEIKYQGKDFPITGTLDDMVKLLGPYRYVESRYNYVWDNLGLRVFIDDKSKGVTSIDLVLNREESDVEMAYRLSGTPELLKELEEIKTAEPQNFFRGELVMEGALIKKEIDFEQVNQTRDAYLKTQTGPDAHLIPIVESWENTRYAVNRSCADGGHLRFIFRIASAVPPYQMKTLSIGSDNASNSSIKYDAHESELNFIRDSATK